MSFFWRIWLAHMKNMGPKGVMTLVGLSSALIMALYLLLFALDQRSYDRHWEGAERIYRVQTQNTQSDRRVLDNSRSQIWIADILRQDIGDDLEVVSHYHRSKPVLWIDNTPVESDVNWVDQYFLDMFQLSEIAGDLRAALADIRAVALSENEARRLFGADIALSDLIGKVIGITEAGRTDNFTVRAIYANPPRQSVMALPAIARLDRNFLTGRLDIFSGGKRPDMTSMWTYVRIAADADLANLRSLLARDIPDREFSVREDGPLGPDATGSDYTRFIMVPLTDLYLIGKGWYETGPTSDARQVSVLLQVGVVILLLAAANHINMLSAQATARAREVALRKALGASERLLRRSFFAEYTLVTLVAVIGAALVLPLVAPVISAAFAFEFTLDYLSGSAWLLMMTVAVVLPLSTSIYPAYTVVRARPAEVLRANQSRRSSSLVLLVRRGVVFVQFLMIMVLLGLTMIFSRQMTFLTTENLGYEPEQMIALFNSYKGGAARNRALLKREIMALPEVESMTAVYTAPAWGGRSLSRLSRPENGQMITAWDIATNGDIVRSAGLTLLAGRDLDPERYPTDDLPMAPKDGKTDLESAVVLNRLATEKLGFASPEAAVGETVTISFTMEAQRLHVALTIVGVVENARYYQIKAAPPPMAFYHAPIQTYISLVRFQGAEQRAVEAIKGVWRRVAPTVVFRYLTQRDIIAGKLKTEDQLVALSSWLVVMALLLCAIGVLADASTRLERLEKPICIRKIFGASRVRLFVMILGQLLAPVLLAAIPAVPLIYYFGADWLASYPHRTDILISDLLWPVMLTIGLVLLVAAQGLVRAVKIRPVELLREE